MKRAKFSFALAAVSMLAFGASARADSATTSIAASGGLQAVSARVDVGHMKLKFGVCASAPCPLGDERTIILTGGADEKNVRATTVDMSGGRHALWVHVPSLVGSGAWDAVLVGRAADPVLFADETGKVHGQPGDMSGSKIEVIPDGAGHSYVARGSISESYTICEREVLANAAVLEPQSLEWRGASFQQLDGSEIARAVVIHAAARQVPAEKPLAPILHARFASSGAHPDAIADQDPSTVWSEGAAGVGRGQFVVFGTPSEVAISKLAITIAPPSPSATGAAPKRFFLATKDQLFSIEMPEDAWAHPARAYDIALPEPVKSSCLALVLDEAFSAPGKSDVSIADIAAYSELDVAGVTLDAVAADLGAGGERAKVAEAILKRAGDAALAPIANAWPKLDVVGHARAIDAAEGATCGADATRVFLNGLCENDPEIARKAEIAMTQCKQSSAIALAVQSMPKPPCKRVPSELAILGKQAALPKLAEWMHTDDVDMRANVRREFARAAQEASAQMLAAMIDDPKQTPLVRLEMLRAIGPRLSDIQSNATRALDALLAHADMSTRYLALEPLAALAKSGERTSAARVAQMLAHDPDWPVRARAAELARDLPAVQSELVSAIDDAEPRVRQSALDTIAALRVSPAAVLVEKRLESDPWTFVRVAAAHALSSMGAARDLDKALATALDDKSPQVRSAVLDALAEHRARDYASAVRARLDDEQELGDVRVSAVHALGAMCDPAQLERLTELARAAADPMASGEDLTLGLAAITALGDMHPADLATRLHKLRDKSVRDAVRAAAEHALSTPSRCSR
jgi:HEAT repeat protein